MRRGCNQGSADSRVRVLFVPQRDSRTRLSALRENLRRTQRYWEIAVEKEEFLFFLRFYSVKLLCVDPWFQSGSHQMNRRSRINRRLGRPLNATDASLSVDWRTALSARPAF